MNRYLLAGSAVVALALGAGSANAQGKFEVRMGGDAVFEAAFVGQDRDTNTRSSEFFERFRLNIVATGTADNGLKYGGRFRIRANANGTMDHDRAYIFVSGNFGQVRMGETNSYNDDAGAVYWPIAYQTGPLLLNARAVSYASATQDTTAINAGLTDYSITNNASKIVYYSPRFSGFQLGASYTNRTDSRGQDVDRSKNTNAYGDVWEIGANYKGEFSGLGVALGGGYFGGQVLDTGNTQLEDLSAWQLGGSLSYAGFTVGVGYIDYTDSGLVKSNANSDGTQILGVGLQYETGPLTVGMSYTRGEGNMGAAGTQTQTVAGVTSYLGQVEQDYYSVGALYAVAPGLLVGAEYAHIKADAPNVAGGTNYDDEADVFILRSALVF